MLIQQQWRQHGPWDSAKILRQPHSTQDRIAKLSKSDHQTKQIAPLRMSLPSVTMEAASQEADNGTVAVAASSVPPTTFSTERVTSLHECFTLDYKNRANSHHNHPPAP